MSTATDRSTRVLVVDDEENITFLLGSALRHFGFDVSTAATGRQGLDAVRSFEPDLVLLDAMLADPDGFEVCRRRREAGGRVRVLSRAQILDHVWEYDFGGNTSVVDTYISYLRKKVDRVDPPLIHTVRGVGYSLRTA